VNIANPHQGLHVRLVWLGLQRVAQKNNGQYFILGNHGPDLLIAAQRPRKHTGYFQAGLFLQQPPGGTSGYQGKTRKQGFVVFGKRDHIGFLAIVGNKGQCFHRFYITDDLGAAALAAKKVC